MATITCIFIVVVFCRVALCRGVLLCVWCVAVYRLYGCSGGVVMCCNVLLFVKLLYFCMFAYINYTKILAGANTGAGTSDTTGVVSGGGSSNTGGPIVAPTCGM